MAEDRMTLLTAKEACEYLRLSLFTLAKIEKQGKLVPFRTPGGHRRYSLAMLNEYLERSRQQRSRQRSSLRDHRYKETTRQECLVGVLPSGGIRPHGIQGRGQS